MRLVEKLDKSMHRSPGQGLYQRFSRYSYPVSCYENPKDMYTAMPWAYYSKTQWMQTKSEQNFNKKCAKGHKVTNMQKLPNGSTICLRLRSDHYPWYFWVRSRLCTCWHPILSAVTSPQISASHSSEFNVRTARMRYTNLALKWSVWSEASSP